MRVQVPIRVERLPPELGGHRASTVFGTCRSGSHPDLGEALDGLARSLESWLRTLSRDRRHRALLEVTFAPGLEAHSWDLQLQLRRGRPVATLLVVAFRDRDSRVAFVPGAAMPWFRVERGADLRQRACEELSAWLTALEKSGHDVDLGELLPAGRSWLSTLEVDLEVESGQLTGDPAVEAGQAELELVGTPWHRRDPGQHDRAVEREAELAELDGLLRADSPQSVLLVGDEGVGKTTLVVEHVARRRELDGEHARQVWHLTPGRILAGMSSVGEWEERLLSILSAACAHDHLLALDDLPGLCRAGASRHSRIGMGEVLRDFLVQRPARIVAEITPAGLGILQELDPALLELFRLLPVLEPERPRALQMVLAATRRLEAFYSVTMEARALVAAVELSGRVQRDGALPGRAVRAVRELARRHEGERIDEGFVRAAFQRATGLAAACFDDSIALRREEIVSALGAAVVGQEAAVSALADLVLVAKARLGAQGRPLGCLMFAGPPGVGKTHCARALASYLYPREDRLLRFNMSELGDAGAAARLAGLPGGISGGGPAALEGLLTGAILRQPFSVILFEGIEHAHPEVHDLLLQVLGEGRLSDGSGRTASFEDAVVILTCGLGAGGASGLGFGDVGGTDAHLDAVTRFFRPELVNRIDRLIPFRRLGEEELLVIARRLLDLVLARRGFARRNVFVRIEPAVLERVVARGTHPELGARALGRALESEVTSPLAARLSTLHPQAPTVLRVVATPAGTRVEARALEAKRTASLPASSTATDARDAAEEVIAELGRLGTLLEERRPGAIDLGGLSAEQMRYFAAREDLQHLERKARWLLGRAGGGTERRRTGRGSRSPGRERRGETPFQLSAPDVAALWERGFDSGDCRGAMRRLCEERAAAGDTLDDIVLELLRELALLCISIGDGGPGELEEATLSVRVMQRAGGGRGFGGAPAAGAHLLALYADLLGASFGHMVVATEPAGDDSLVVRGFGVCNWLSRENGAFLFLAADGSLNPAEVVVECGQRTLPGLGDPRVGRVLCEGGPLLDLESGALCPDALARRSLQALMISRLPPMRPQDMVTP